MALLEDLIDEVDDAPEEHGEYRVLVRIDGEEDAYYDFAHIEWDHAEERAILCVGYNVTHEIE